MITVCSAANQKIPVQNNTSRKGLKKLSLILAMQSTALKLALLVQLRGLQNVV